MSQDANVSPARCPKCRASLPAVMPVTCPHCGTALSTVPARAQTQEMLYERGIRRVITAGLLLAITLLLAFTRIGFIPVPTPAANATITHIPAIVAGILEGPLVGLIVGLGFGFASFMNATIPMFKDPLVAVIPRLLIGVTAAWTYAVLRRANRHVFMALVAVLGVLGLLSAYELAQQKELVWVGVRIAPLAVGVVVAAVSTTCVALLYWWIHRQDSRIVALAIAAAVGSLTNTVLVLGAAVWRGYIPAGVALVIGLSHGVPELIISAVIVVAVVAALRQIGQRRRGARL
jgi:uncharacterized membrane protein